MIGRRHTRRVTLTVPILLGLLSLGVAVHAQPDGPEAVEYRLSFPAPEHRWLEVEATFPELDEIPFTVVMSTASPGRYARHEFAKNVFDVRITDGRGNVLTYSRPNAHAWEVADHDGTVRVRYRLFGDRVDGTYAAVDSTHAHLNIPATLMWAPGLEDRPAQIAFAVPAGTDWRVATQLFPTDDPWVFTAPNLDYLMDSPAELSDHELHTFSMPDPGMPARRPTFRVAVHHDADGGVTPYVASVEAIVREMVQIFGEFPEFETGRYTFIADYLSYADSDGMEHRNSTILTSTGRLDDAAQRERLLGTVAHEFFHVWNVERIRPRSLEPFDLTDANVSGELWLGEGFTNYYGKLVMMRSGQTTLANTLQTFGATLDTVATSPGRRLNSVVDMSRLAPFTDAATAIDRTNFSNTFISYYTWGEAIALGLDLTLRARSDGRVTLDDYMRALWSRFGTPTRAIAGRVETPYTPADLRAVLAEVDGDQRFADEFFARYVDGRDLMDYTELFGRAGLVLRARAPGRASLGRVRVAAGPTIAQPTPYGSPLYEAGVDRSDVVTMLDGQTVSSVRDLSRILAERRPGDTVAIGFLRRGRPVESSVTLIEDPGLELVSLESAGGRLTSEQEEFRRAWLGSQQ